MVSLKNGLAKVIYTLPSDVPEVGFHIDITPDGKTIIYAIDGI